MAPPTTAPSLSKGQVNRAAARWVQFFAAVRNPESDRLAEFDFEQIEEDAQAIEWWRGEHAYPLRMASAGLRHYIPPFSGGKRLVTQRLKRFGTIIDKLEREPTMAITQMADIGGVRARLPDQKAVASVTRRLRKNWDVPRVRDYVADPKPSGYRAVHLIVRKKSRLIEVQLRTPLQDLWANTVEDDSRRVRVGYKSGVGDQAVHDYYMAMSEFFALRERGEEADEEFRKRLNGLAEAARPYLAPSAPKREGR